MRRQITRILASFLACAIIFSSPCALSAEAAKKKTSKTGTAGVVKITSTSDQLLNDVLARYNLIPMEIRNAFEVLDWRIEIMRIDKLMAYRGVNATQYPWYYEVAGTTLADRKLIALNDKADYSAESITHEMGHFFDIVLTTIDGSSRAGNRPAFYAIFNEEKASIGDSYTSSSPTEFFAECFKLYVENPDHLYQNCPKSFNYIDGEVRKYQFYVGNTTNFDLPPATTAQVTADFHYLYNGLDYTAVFSAWEYYSRYPDLQKAIGYDPLRLFQHFIQYGIREGRVAI